MKVLLKLTRPGRQETEVCNLGYTHEVAPEEDEVKWIIAEAKDLEESIQRAIHRYRADGWGLALATVKLEFI